MFGTATSAAPDPLEVSTVLETAPLSVTLTAPLGAVPSASRTVTRMTCRPFTGAPAVVADSVPGVTAATVTLAVSYEVVSSNGLQRIRAGCRRERNRRRRAGNHGLGPRSECRATQRHR